MTTPATSSTVKRHLDFSLTSPSVSSISWWLAVLLGWSLIGTALFETITASDIDLAAALAMTALLLVVLELLPLVQGRGHDPQGVVMSTAFTIAMLALWGLWPAVIMIAFASVAADLRARKAWWKVAFNPAQYALSVGAAFLPVLAAGNNPSLERPLDHFVLSDMPWMIGVWTVYFVVNTVVVSGVLAWASSFKAAVLDDVVHLFLMTFAVLAISPLIVVVAQRAWPLLPLLLVPLLLLFHTAQMALQREHDAGHDPLTGLPNRSNLRYQLSEAIARFHSDEVPFGLILIDLDDFKRVNDTLGHSVGDELLRQFAQRLEQSVRTGDHVARLGGDEFAVLVFDAEAADVWIVADRIAAVIAESVDLSGIALHVELSLGIVICPEHGMDGDTLLQRADVAMYVAKENRTVIEIYSPDRDDNSADRLGLLGELRQALDEDGLELHYQPKVSTSTGDLLGMEALVRWNHPQRGYIPPDEFIPLAERSGIMPMLTEQVVTLAIGQMARWRDAGVEVPVAVNIAPTDLGGDHLVDVVEQGLAHYEIPPRMLRLEITERMFTRQITDTRTALNRLRHIGVTISLDDFGTGYSSLLRLSSLPVDEIKIDRVFVSAMSSGERAVGIVRALIDLAHALSVPAVAEGVQTEEEWQQLQTLGCDGVQGWHVAMPMSIGEATKWVMDRAAIVRFEPQPVVRPDSSDLLDAGR